MVKAYLELIRDLTYDIEDCFEEFMVFIKNKSLLQQLLSLRARHRIAVQIRALKQRVQEVTQRNQRGDTELIRNLSALYVEEAQLVGLDEPKKKLMALVTQPEDKSMVAAQTSKAGPRMVSVVGMGGLGKTTLTKKVYDTKDLRDKFDSHAWITISQTFDRKELLKGMVDQLFGLDSFKRLLEEHQGKVLEVHHLTTYLQGRLWEKRYFIVLDDVWTTEACNFFKLSFPDNSKDGSRVVVTTRDGKLAEQFCSSSYIHQLKFLEKEVAKSLFLKKAQKRPDDLDKDDHTKGTVEKILNKCGGLPLAIVTIGANKDTKEWENLYNQLPSELSSNPSLEDLRRVVHLSYNHLPSHLKPCGTSCRVSCSINLYDCILCFLILVILPVCNNLASRLVNYVKFSL
ncbi:hypothetical protein C2845_PM10G10400 [Panicum miliaceum]|uniref:NB-ARC domain-containing protein n=1 Tax=Panicum miliaceum TaxID=4540 RepID=A0A3L6PI88_PANMI|nr:hypothetical protein C2845_PM10G10400 [Panicum miliaceum]